MKRFLLVLLLLSLTLPLCAQFFSALPADFRFSLEPRLGITYGSMGEYLYMQYNDSWKKNSYLEWEEKPLVTVGLAASSGYKRIQVQAYADYALPLACGNLYDKDWMNDAQPDLLTTRSVHDVTAETVVSTGLSCSFDFYPHEKVILSPLVQVEFAYTSLKAENGEAWHGEKRRTGNASDVAWNDDSAKYYRKGLVADIAYARQSLYTFFGMQVTFRETERLQVALSVLVSPYTYAFSRDIHYGWDTATRTQFKGQYYVGKASSSFDRLRGTAAVYYRVHDRVTLGITATGLVGDMTKGTFYDEDADSGKIYKKTDYQSGFSVYEASLRFSAKVRLK